MSSTSQALVRVALLSAIGLSLAACDTLRSVAGNDKQPPDEFAVVTKAPLIIPPDYNLHPPKPGAAPLNQTSPTQSAQLNASSSKPYFPPSSGMVDAVTSSRPKVLSRQ